MGQAKRRGPFEDRKQQSIQAREDEIHAAAEKRIAERLAEQDRIAAMTPEELEARYRAAPRPNRRRSSMAAMLAMGALIGGAYM
jgi:ferric-dicitrate binding protein FerR (iron transport regulator)